MTVEVYTLLVNGSGGSSIFLTTPNGSQLFGHFSRKNCMNITKRKLRGGVANLMRLSKCTNEILVVRIYNFIQLLFGPLNVIFLLVFST